MIKNKKLKIILSKTVFKVISAINQIVPKNDDIILLYSNMGFRDNIAYLYNYLIENGYNEKYKIFRSHEEKYEGDIPHNVTVISNAKATFYYLRAGHVFYCFGKLPIYPSKHQDVIQMWHGTAFKGLDNWQLKCRTKKSYYTKFVVSSDYFSDIAIKYQGAPPNGIVVCGQPRTDVMFEENAKYDELLPFSKVIIWMPTFRSSSLLGYQDVDDAKQLIPLFDSNEYDILNNKLADMNICLIVKLHPVQDGENFEKNYSNLYLLTNSEFNQKGWDLYRLLGQCDALITDYSSVFYDFMLLDRPMAFTVDDLNEYGKCRGFIVDDPDYITAGYKLKTKDELYAFLNDVAAGIDAYSDARHEVNALVNTYNDGKQCKRLLDRANIRLMKNNGYV